MSHSSSEVRKRCAHKCMFILIPSAPLLLFSTRAPLRSPSSWLCGNKQALAKQLLPGQLCRLCHRAVWVKEQAPPTQAQPPNHLASHTTEFNPPHSCKGSTATHSATSCIPRLSSLRVLWHLSSVWFLPCLSPFDRLLCVVARKLAYFCWHVERSRARQSKCAMELSG